ncbi:MAG: PFL family protein [Candidatus Hadarchaeales archaeon]
MKFTSEEILETFRMLHVESLDIRAITLGINLLDCVSGNEITTSSKIQKKIRDVASGFVDAVDSVSGEFGVPVTNRRIAVTPVSLLLGTSPTRKNALEIAMALERSATTAGVDLIGGFSALVEKGITQADSALMDSIPETLAKTEKLCSSVNVASTRAGINLDAINIMASKVKETARLTAKNNGIGCARLSVFCNAPGDNPFMAGAFHGVDEGEATINVAISGPSVIRAAVESCDGNADELSDVIKRAAFKMTRVGELIGREVAKRIGVKFGIVDTSIAPTTAPGDSVADVVEKMGVERCGAPGTTAAVAMLVDSVKKGGMMACTRVGGLSGALIPVTEDGGMSRRVAEGCMTIEKLEALTSVCSVGLDMICVPGDTDVWTIGGLIADQAAIGIINDKTTSVRVIPVPGKKPGDSVDFGGLFGKGVVVRVQKWSPERFLRRGGQISRAARSAKN